MLERTGRQLSDHPSVFAFDGFDSRHQDRRWKLGSGHEPRSRIRMIEGRSGLLDATIRKGQLTGANLELSLRNADGAEPDAMFLRYYLYLGADFQHAAQGGKFPGLAGTYGRAGWGGRRSDGRNGWSARGLFKDPVTISGNADSVIPIGTYLYHAQMPSSYGDALVWSTDRLGLLETGRWYCIEQQVVMNSPGSADGILRGWIDGQLAYENTSVQYRNSPLLHIEKAWLNVYHGGTMPAPRDLPVYLDDVVVATEYIGPEG